VQSFNKNDYSFIFVRNPMQLNFLFRRAVVVQITLILLVGFLVVGCKKDAEVDHSELLRKLQGKWMVGSYFTNEHSSGADHNNPFPVSPGDFFEFAPGEKLQMRLFGSTETFNFAVVADNRITIDYSDTFDIRTLTEQQLILYNKKVYSADSYKEQTFNLQK
jgi:hypothetical protein